MTNIVRNNTKGFGYNYASLSDIAQQGIEIPKMKTGTENGKEYVFYFDEELNEWIRGCEIVIPQTKGQNEAQMYMSAVTYARRGTTHLAKRLATTDDQIIENIKDDGEMKQGEPLGKEEQPITSGQLRWMEANIQGQNLASVLKSFGISCLDELTKTQASETISQFKEWMKKNEKSDKQ